MSADKIMKATSSNSVHQNGSTANRAPLQQQAQVNIQHQIIRSLVRVFLLIISDVMTIIALIALIGLSANSIGIIHSQYSPIVVPLAENMVQLLQFICGIIIGIALSRNYGSGSYRNSPGFLVLGVFWGMCLFYWVPLWNQPTLILVQDFFVLLSLLGFSIIIERHLIDKYIQISNIGKTSRHLAVLVGLATEISPRETEKRTIELNGLTIVGAIDINTPFHPSTLGSLVDMPRVLNSYNIDTIIIHDDLPDEAYEHVVDNAMAARCQVYTISERFNMPGAKPSIVWNEGSPVVSLTSVNLDAWQMLFKRVMDISGSLVGLILLSPIFLGIAIAIKIDSKGSVLFRQKRIGQAGLSFSIFKFRSMISDAENQLDDLQSKSIYSSTQLFKIPNDPRVTRIGRLLRVSSLDELPQLLNVLIGNMSLVGPRPPLPFEVESYRDHHYCRFDVKPGITGPWQVSGRNEILEFEEVIRLETEYIRSWSIIRDVKILLKTIPAVLKQKGAF